MTKEMSYNEVSFVCDKMQELLQYMSVLVYGTKSMGPISNPEVLCIETCLSNLRLNCGFLMNILSMKVAHPSLESVVMC